MGDRSLAVGEATAIVGRLQKKYPLGFGQPEDVAYSAVYLLSNATKWMTGTTIKIDGGVTL